MNGFVDYLMHRYGEEELDKDDLDLIQETFWSDLRASLYKKINKGNDGSYQWAYITGKKSRYPDGSKIFLSRSTIKFLEQTVEYLNSTEGVEELSDAGISEPPEHMDDLVGLLSNAKTDRVIKRDQFRLFLKHKHKIMKFLLR